MQLRNDMKPESIEMREIEVKLKETKAIYNPMIFLPCNFFYESVVFYAEF